jgi:hypothetical protein
MGLSPRYHWLLHWVALASFWKTHRLQLKDLALGGVMKILLKYSVYVKQVWTFYGTVLRVALPMAKAATGTQGDFQRYARMLYERHKRLLDAGDNVSDTRFCPVSRVLFCYLSKSQHAHTRYRPPDLHSSCMALGKRRIDVLRGKGLVLSSGMQLSVLWGLFVDGPEVCRNMFETICGWLFTR